MTDEIGLGTGVGGSSHAQQATVARLTFAFVDDLPDAVVERHCDGNIGLC